MSYLMRKSNMVILVTVIACILMFAVKPADATRSYQQRLVTIFYIPYTVSYTVGSTVDGWDSSDYSGRIWVDRYACNGVIKNYQAYPFDMSVMVRGKFYEGNNNVLTWYNYDLSRYSIIYDPKDRPWWGGEMFPKMYMGKNTKNNVWVETVWSAEGDIFPVYDEFNHIFYDNGWKNVI